MSLVAFTSTKGAPGVTTTALATAAAWPAGERGKLLVEADPDGGVLAARYQLGRDPGIVTLAAAAHHGLDVDGLWRHAQQLPGGLPVVLGSDLGEQTDRALAQAGATLGQWLAQQGDLTAIADCGRIGHRSGAMSFVEQADLVLMVSRPSIEQLHPAARRLAELAQRCRNVGWVLVGDDGVSPQEIAAQYRFPVWGVIADDRRGADQLAHGGRTRVVDRSRLVRSARSLADALGPPSRGHHEMPATTRARQVKQ